MCGSTHAPVPSMRSKLQWMQNAHANAISRAVVWLGHLGYYREMSVVDDDYTLMKKK